MVLHLDHLLGAEELSRAAQEEEEADGDVEPAVEDVTSPNFSEITGVQTAASVWLPSSQAAQHSNKVLARR